MSLALKILSLIFALCCCTVQAQSKTDFNALGKKAYAQWDCSAFGLLTTSRLPSAEKLFEQGLKNLEKFLSAANEGKLNKENIKNVPIGLSWNYISGPSLDFSLGYMWAKFTEKAYDDTWEQIDGTSFDKLKELQALKAEQTFGEKNCGLLVQ